MQLLKFKSLLLGVSFASVIVSALPFSSHSSEVDVVEREYEDELLQRNGELFAKHGSYGKAAAVEFVKNIPIKKLQDGGCIREGQCTIHTADEKGRENLKRPENGYRLDYQGPTTDGKYHNIQVQLNGNGHSGKTSIGGLIVKGTWGAKRTKKELIHSIMHPARDKNNHEFMYKQHDGKAPKGTELKKDGTPKSLTNKQAREARRPWNVDKPRNPKPRSPLAKAKSERKAERGAERRAERIRLRG